MSEFLIMRFFLGVHLSENICSNIDSLQLRCTGRGIFVYSLYIDEITKTDSKANKIHIVLLIVKIFPIHRYIFANVFL